MYPDQILIFHRIMIRSDTQDFDKYNLKLILSTVQIVLRPNQFDI